MSKEIKMKRSYNEMRKLFLEGKISELAWKAFCMDVLHEVLTENKDVFERLAKV